MSSYRGPSTSFLSVTVQKLYINRRSPVTRQYLALLSEGGMLERVRWVWRRWYGTFPRLSNRIKLGLFHTVGGSEIRLTSWGWDPFIPLFTMVLAPSIPGGWPWDPWDVWTINTIGFIWDLCFIPLGSLETWFQNLPVSRKDFPLSQILQVFGSYLGILNWVKLLTEIPQGFPSQHFLDFKKKERFPKLVCVDFCLKSLKIRVSVYYILYTSKMCERETWHAQAASGEGMMYHGHVFGMEGTYIDGHHTTCHINYGHQQHTQ